VNIVPTVPPVVLLLVKNPIARKYDLSSMQLLISAAAPLSKELSNEFVKTYKTKIKQAYGTYLSYKKKPELFFYLLFFFFFRFN
jgi:4-coumarate--CoA ligase